MKRLAAIKFVVFILCLLPFGWYAGDFLLNGVAGVFERYADPIQTIEHQSGDWALRFLLITLAITPLRIISGWTVLLRFRRMLGLFAFFYVCLHFLIYLLLDLEIDFPEVKEDILDRPYITVGFTAFLLLIPLAVTSTKGMMRRLGRRWKQLHRLVYLIAILGVVHFWWLVKADVREPLIYASILALLYATRLVAGYRQRRLTAARSQAG